MQSSDNGASAAAGAEVPGRITSQQAIKITGLNTSGAFTTFRQMLEEAWDPATGATIPIPEPLRIPHLSASQLKALTPEEAVNHTRLKSARAAWTRSHCMRVVVWGGLCVPGGEYRFSAARCAEWRERALGELER